MSKVFKQALLPVIAIYCVSSTAFASELQSSPISFILEEAGISTASDMNQARRTPTPYLGNESITLPTKRGSKMKLHGKNIRKNRSIDHIYLDLGKNKARCEELEEKLATKYGDPKSKRNNIRVWELNNAAGSTGQSKKVTIMAGEERGQYFLTVDRKGPRKGNNPRTNASLRKVKTKNLKRTKTSQVRPKVDRRVTD
jgi:hypothetical protein